MNKPSQKPKSKTTAQAMVEFALALPILLLVIYGLLETGRLLFMFASVVTAARNAARYGSATGLTTSGTNYYDDCSGIIAAANRTAFIQTFSDITISYDSGPGTPAIGSGCPMAQDPSNGDRIIVSVSSVFNPIVPLVPLRQIPITSTDRRTLLVAALIQVTPPPGGGGGTSALTLIKDAQGPYSDKPKTYRAAGDVITYTYTLRNDGTTDLSGPFTVTDNKFVPQSFTCSSGTLAAGASTSCTKTYTITDPDVTATFVTNVATATDGSKSVLSNSATQTVTLDASAAISLTKTGVAPKTITPGQDIQYTFVITNTGNVPVTPPYTIVDSLIGTNWSCGNNPPNPLAVGSTLTCTGQYAITNQDINTGSVTNTAHAIAKYGSADVVSPDAKAVVLTPPLQLDLSASPTSISAPGQVITYTYTITNRMAAKTTGTIFVSDQRGASNFACVTTTLNSGKSGSCTHTYTVTQADFDSPLGYLSNTATATTILNGSTINSNPAGVNVMLLQGPSISLTKTAAPVLTGPGQFFSTGQLITYTYTVKNIGNVTITPTTATPIKITDSDPRVVMSTGCTITSGPVAPNGTVSCTGGLTLQDSDIAAGSVTSTGTASATFGSTALTATATYTLKTFYDGRVSVIKTADKTSFIAAGDKITYSYWIKNTGGQVLTIATGYALSDNKTGAIGCPQATAGKTLQLGASIPCNTSTYTVTPADVNAAKVVNIASVASGSMTTATTTVPGTVTVTLLVCDATHPTSSPLSPIIDGSNTTWGILNNTGTTLTIASMTISWGGGNLTQVSLGAQPVWSGSQPPNGLVPLNTTGWPAIAYDPVNPTIMSFKFSSTATGIKVSLMFNEKVGTNQCSLNSP